MTRRSFFGLIAGGLAAAADPERLLWAPGRRLISIPRPPVLVDHHLAIDFQLEDPGSLSLADFEAQYIVPAVHALADQIERDFVRNLNHPFLVPLGPPFGVVSKQLATQRLPHARVTLIHDVEAGELRGRVDCLVRGGERRWEARSNGC